LVKKKIILMAMVMLFMGSSVFAGDSVYTNKDLERYHSRSLSPDITLKYSKISVDFQDADVYQVLRMIAEVVKKEDDVEMFVSPEISGKITIKMINVPWNEILKEIVQEHNLTTKFLGKRALLIY